MDDRLDEIMARHEAATSCGCCCDDEFAAYVDQKTPMTPGDRLKTDQPLPDSAAGVRRSVRYVFENRVDDPGKPSR